MVGGLVGGVLWRVEHRQGVSCEEQVSLNMSQGCLGFYRIVGGCEKLDHVQE